MAVYERQPQVEVNAKVAGELRRMADMVASGELDALGWTVNNTIDWVSTDGFSLIPMCTGIEIYTVTVRRQKLE